MPSLAFLSSLSLPPLHPAPPRSPSSRTLTLGAQVSSGTVPAQMHFISPRKRRTGSAHAALDQETPGWVCDLSGGGLLLHPFRDCLPASACSGILSASACIVMKPTCPGGERVRERERERSVAPTSVAFPEPRATPPPQEAQG